MPKFTNVAGEVIEYQTVITVIGKSGQVTHLDSNREEITEKGSKVPLILISVKDSVPFYLETSALSGEREDKYYQERSDKEFEKSEFGIAKEKIIKNLGI